MLIGACTLLGLMIGSFLNVVVWRVPRGESVAHPPSACPRCGHAVRPRDNVPVLSWLLLRGRCRDCAEPISPRYPLVEAGTAVLFGLTAALVGLSWELPAFLYLAAVSVALTLIDLDTRRLPDALVLPSWVVAPALLALAAWNPGSTTDWSALGRALLGGVAMWLVYAGLRSGSTLLLHTEGMGRGDVKLAPVLGVYLAWTGWGALVVGWFAAFLVGGLVSVVLMVAGRAGRRSRVPFGPFMIAGAVVGIAWGTPLADAYLHLVGLG